MIKLFRTANNTNFLPSPVSRPNPLSLFLQTFPCLFVDIPPSTCPMDFEPSHHLRAKASAQSDDATRRTIQVWENAYNAKKLTDNQWNFQIAKSVVTEEGGKPTFNVVWRSTSIAPSTLVSWFDVYFLNWTVDVPAAGVSVTVSGMWQTCAVGDSYDLDVYGFWTKSSATTKADPRFMNVGNIEYKYPGTDGIHVVIGVQDDSGNIYTIYIDPTALPLGFSAKYQPQELVRWWYETNIRTSTVIDNESTAIGEVDLSKPAPNTSKYYYSTTYNYDSGNWITSEDKPPNALFRPPKALLEIVDVGLGAFTLWGGGSLFTIAFAVELSDAMKGSASLNLGTLLRLKFTNVEVTVIDKFNINVKIGAAKGAKVNSNDAIGAATDDIIRAISDALQVMVTRGELPIQEKWAIQKIAG